MTQKELNQMIREEEQRLGVGCEEFMKRHNEIMELIEHAERGEKNGETIHERCGSS